MPWYGYALISAACIATVGLLEKKTLQREHSSEYVTVFSTIKLSLFLLFFFPSISWGVTNLQFFWLVLDGVIGALAFWLVAKAIRRMEFSSAVPILSLDPGLTAVLAFLYLGERLTPIHVLGLGFMVAGTYVLELHRSHDETKSQAVNRWRTMLSPLTRVWKQPGGIYIIGGLLCFSISSTIDRSLLKEVAVNTYIAYTLITSTAIFLFIFLRSRQTIQILRPGRGYVFFFVMIAAALHLTSNVAQAKAVSIAAVGLVIAIKRLSVLLDVVIGGKFFHERHLAQKAIATVVMLIGVFFIVQP